MSLLHYITYKYVIIRDKRLGAAYYVVLALITLYTLIQVFVNKAYLKYDTSPRGSIRTIVTTPPMKNQGISSTPTYCCSTDTENCTTSCRSLDGLSLYWPVESRAVTIASYIKERLEKQRCDQETYDFAEKHTPYTTVRENAFYTVHPEHAVIKTEHSIKADGGVFTASHRMMHGALVDTQGKVIKRLKSDAVDKLFLSDYLTAAGINLDDESDALNSKGRKYRKIGIVLQVLIDYRNSQGFSFGTGRVQYTYRVEHLRYSDYRVKQEIPIVSNNGSICQRIVNKRFGVRLEFQQVGKIGQFCLSNLVMQLVSFMGLLTLTATIIDLLALYVAPDKDTYRQYIYDSSPDLHENSQEQNEQEHKEKEE